MSEHNTPGAGIIHEKSKARGIYSNLLGRFGSGADPDFSKKWAICKQLAIVLVKREPHIPKDFALITLADFKVMSDIAVTSGFNIFQHNTPKDDTDVECKFFVIDGINRIAYVCEDIAKTD